MRVDRSSVLNKLPVEAQVEGAILKKKKDSDESIGEQNLKLIDNAILNPSHENRPLKSGPIGRTINIKS